jgi:hypothetical protein
MPRVPGPAEQPPEQKGRAGSDSAIFRRQRQLIGLRDDEGHEALSHPSAAGGQARASPSASRFVASEGLTCALSLRTQPSRRKPMAYRYTQAAVPRCRPASLNTQPGCLRQRRDFARMSAATRSGSPLMLGREKPHQLASAFWSSLDNLTGTISHPRAADGNRPGRRGTCCGSPRRKRKNASRSKGLRGHPFRKLDSCSRKPRRPQCTKRSTNPAIV